MDLPGRRRRDPEDGATPSSTDGEGPSGWRLEEPLGRQGSGAMAHGWWDPDSGGHGSWERQGWRRRLVAASPSELRRWRAASLDGVWSTCTTRRRWKLKQLHQHIDFFYFLCEWVIITNSTIWWNTS